MESVLIQNPKSKIQNPSVLIAMNDAGGGHRRLSEALAHAFERLTEGTAQVSIEDVFALDRRSWPYRLGRLYGPTIRHLPGLYGLVYHAANGPRRARRLLRDAQAPLLPAVRRLVRELQPSAVVTTHPLVQALVLDALEAERLRAPVLAQVSELVSVHASWVEPRITAYAVATEEARLAVLRHGAPAARVRVLGLPIGPTFAQAGPSAAETRRALGLDPDRFTLLALGGGEGAGKLQMAVEALVESGLELQLVVVCGRNVGLERRLQALVAPFPMRVFGYVDTVAELMAACDVVLTKGGPQTIAEAFARGRPVLVTQTLPGQERGNEVLVQRANAGFYVPTPARVVAATARLALDEPLRATMSAAARQLARPAAAASVAQWALALAESRRQ
ncbi:MAG: glycosyltransferase [Chloroflexi bacterium]|nr:glycosyltransferase [Chloroflexota bacterium]